LLGVLGDRADHTLTEIDETGLLDLAVRHGIIDDGMQSRYYPDLDYIANVEPENSFRYAL
jgi:hypothetical protein